MKAFNRIMAAGRELATVFALIAVAAAPAGCAGQQEALDLAEALQSQAGTVKVAIGRMEERHKAEVEVQRALYDVATLLKDRLREEAMTRLDKQYFELLSRLNAAETEASSDLSEHYNTLLENKIVDDINEIFKAPEEKLEKDLRKLQEMEDGTLTGIQKAKRDNLRISFLANRSEIAEGRAQIVYTYFSELGGFYTKKLNEIKNVAKTERENLKKEYEEQQVSSKTEIDKIVMDIKIGEKIIFEDAPYRALAEWVKSTGKTGKSLERYINANSFFGRDSIARSALYSAVDGFIGRSKEAQEAATDSDSGEKNKANGNIPASLIGTVMDDLDPSAPFKSIRKSIGSYFEDALRQSKAEAEKKARELMEKGS